MTPKTYRIELTAQEAKLVEDVIRVLMGADAGTYIKKSARKDGRILSGTEDELDTLAGFISAGAGHAPTLLQRDTLDEVLSKIEQALP